MAHTFIHDCEAVGRMYSYKQKSRQWNDLPIGYAARRHIDVDAFELSCT